MSATPSTSSVLSFVDVGAIRPMKVVLDGGNGMAGPMVGPLLERIPGLELVPTYWEPDGEFPDHEPNPLLPENRRFVIDKVRSDGRRPRASPGTATPTAASSSTATASSPTATSSARCWPAACSRSAPGADILYDVRSSRAVPDTVREAGGTPLINRVGHAFFKTRMRDEGGAFGGEVSGHYYFADFYNADSGTLPALLMLELLGRTGRTLAELLEPYRSRYFISGEINSEVADQAAKIEEIRARYADAEITELDGISVDYDDWHFNVRASNTEPLPAPVPGEPRVARGHGGPARRGAQADPQLTSASSTAATVGRRSAPARVAAKTWRAGAAPRAGARPRPAGTAACASRGTSATPRPAPTSAIVVWKSSERCAKAGAKPAAAQPVIVTSWQEVPSGGPTNGSRGERGERDLVERGERMALRQHGVERVGAQRRGVEARVVGRRRLAGGHRERDVGVAAASARSSAAPPAPRRRASAAGGSARSAAAAGAAISASPVAKPATRTVPTIPSANAATSASAASSWASTRLAWPTSTSAAPVSRTPRPLRSTTGWPTSRSSAASCWETADGVRWSTSAAAASVPCSATSRRTRRRRTSIIQRILRIGSGMSTRS